MDPVKMKRARFARGVAALALTGALAGGLAGCGAPQTLQPYTPAAGVNTDIGPEGATPLKVRNLLVISREPGQGFLSGAIVSPTDQVVPEGIVTRRVPVPADALVGVSGAALAPNDAPEGQFAPVQTNVTLPPGQLVVLTDQQPIQLTAPGLTPGLLADVTLTFRSGATTTLRVPVVDGNLPDYRTVTPGPPAGSASPSAGATPAAGATPSPAATPG